MGSDLNGGIFYPCNETQSQPSAMPSKSTGRTPWFLYSTHIRAICMSAFSCKQFTSLFCQRLYPFITATQPSKNLEPVAALVRLFHCYCNFMNKVITALLTHPLRPQLTHVLHVLNG